MLEENREAEPLKKYYIAYFDLLGYKQFFKSYPDKTGDFLNIIHKAIQNTKDYVQRVNSSVVAGEWGQLAIQAKVFSDNILLCLKSGETLMDDVCCKRCISSASNTTYSQLICGIMK